MNNLLRPAASLCLLGCLIVSAWGEETALKLWGEGAAPGSTGDGHGDVPRLIVTRAQSDSPTAGVVILPGGGYGNLAMDHEGYQFAEWFKELGITSGICVYRHSGAGNHGRGYKHPHPMVDAQRAIQMMRANADQWNLDPNRIGVIGFSAGGHLCSTVSNFAIQGNAESEDPISQVPSRPDFSILCYPVIALNQPYTHKGSQRNLLGDDPDPALIQLMSTEQQVSEKTPPTFIFHTVEDKAVPVENALVYFAACRQHGVPVEMHIYQQGRHGLGLARDTPGASQWPEQCTDWLRRLGMVR